MMRYFLLLTLVLLAAAELHADVTAAASNDQRGSSVDYAREIVPILKRNCLACHYEQEAEGGLNLETHDRLLAGGDSGPGVVANNVDKSLIWRRVTGSEEPLMPPEDNSVGAKPLSADELGLLRTWIQQGATASDVDSQSFPWQEVSASVRPVYALAVSPDGKWLARARGNRVGLFDLATASDAGVLIDRELSEEIGREVTDIDLVQSIAFSPMGDRIATGGFRTVKIWRKVHQRLGASESPLAGAAGPVALGSHGITAAFVNAIGDIEVWDLAETRRLHTLTGHTYRPTALAIAADASRIASVEADGLLRIWNAESGELLVGHDIEATIENVAIDRGGSNVAVTTRDKEILMWRIESPDSNEAGAGDGPAPHLRRVTHDSINNLSGVNVVAFAETQTPQIAAGTESGHVLLIEIGSGKRLQSIQHGAPVDAIAISPDGNQLVTGGRRGKTKIWNTADGSQLRALNGNPIDRLRIHAAELDDARQSALIKRLESRTKAIEDAIEKEQNAVEKVKAKRDEAAQKVAADEKKRQEAEAKARATAAEITKAKQRKIDAEQRIVELNKEIAQLQQAIADSTKTIESADVQADTLAKQLEVDKQSVQTAIDAKKSSRAELNKRQRALDTAIEAQHRLAATLPEHQTLARLQIRRAERMKRRLDEAKTVANDVSRGVVGIAFSLDGKRLGTAHRDGSTMIYRSAETSPISAVITDAKSPTKPPPRGLVLAGDNMHCAFWTSRPAIVRRSTAKWELERTIGSLDDSPISDRVTAIDFRADAMAIAVGSGPPSRAGEVQLFATENGRLLRDFGQIHSDTVLGLRFSPDGMKLASAAADKTIRVVDIASDQMIRSLEGHTHHVLSLAWQDDAQSIASASADQTVKIWDVDSAGQRRTIAGFPKEVTAITFVAQTGQVVTACGDGQVRIHDTTNGKMLRSFSVSNDFLFALAVTPDGKSLVAGGQTGIVQVWDLEDGKLIHEIR